MLISNGLLNLQTNCPSGLSPSQYIKIPIKTPVYRLKPSYVISGSTPLTSSASTLRIPSLAVWAVAAVPLRLVAHLPQAEHQEFPWRKWPNTTARRISGWSSALTLLQFSLVFLFGKGEAPFGKPNRKQLGGSEMTRVVGFLRVKFGEFRNLLSATLWYI